MSGINNIIRRRVEMVGKYLDTSATVEADGIAEHL